MHFQYKVLFLWLLALAAVEDALCDNSLIFASELKDTGYATNCGQEPINMTWTPKVLSAKHSVDVTLDYTVARDMNAGTYNLTVSYYGQAEPFLVYPGKFTCDDIKSVLPCPLKKGFHLKRKQTFSKTKFLLNFLGHLIITAEVKNEEGLQMFCVKMDVMVINY